MADTAHKTDAEVIEHSEDPAVLASKIKELAKIITKSKYFVIWTGAGVSTNTGVPDFRGPQGKWTLAAKGEKRDPKLKTVSTLQAKPSLTHMSIVQLLNQGLLKKLISTNTDGLHRRSGVRADQISELHGNSNRVRCEKCTAAYYKDERTRVAAKVHDHDTGLKCLKCGGKLQDTIINFGEYLHPEVTKEANKHGGKADTLLVLGSSLRVITCDALEDIQEHNGNLIIVNKQITPYDKFCKLRIFADCDEVMQMLMQELSLPIPPPNLTRYFTLDWSQLDSKGSLVLQGTEETFSVPFAFCVGGADLLQQGKVVASAKHGTDWHKPLVFSGLPKAKDGAKSELVMKMNHLRKEGEMRVDLTNIFSKAGPHATSCKVTAEFDDSQQMWSIINVA